MQINIYIDDYIWKLQIQHKPPSPISYTLYQYWMFLRGWGPPHSNQKRSVGHKSLNSYSVILNKNKIIISNFCFQVHIISMSFYNLQISSQINFNHLQVHVYHYLKKHYSSYSIKKLNHLKMYMYIINFLQFWTTSVHWF